MPRKKAIPVGKNQKKQVAAGTRYSSDGMTVAWCFDRIDRNGKFAFDVSSSNFDHKEIIDKLISYGSMTWVDLKKQTHDNKKSKHHFLSPDKVSPEALSRIKSLLLEEEVDSVFSFAFQNLLRIVGVRKDEKFYIMWYDPKHEFCPSRKA